MPWKLRDDHPDCAGTAVVRSDTGSLVTCHPDRDKAAAHLRALYANTGEGHHHGSEAVITARFDPGEMRDRSGRWTRTGGGKPPRLGHIADTGGTGGRGDWTQDWVPDPSGWMPDLTPARGVKNLTSKGRPDGTGTPDDPIDVRGDIGRALTLMQQGKNVRLNQVREVATLLRKVQGIAKESAAAGRKPPDWDFGLLTVRGTDLFTAENRGIPRIAMPQFNGLAQPGTQAAAKAGGAGKFADMVDEFSGQLARDGIKVTEARVPVADLRATQTQLVGDKVAGIAAAMERGDAKARAMMAEPLFVTRDNYVIDGHHRWAAEMMLDALDGTLGNDTYQNVRIVDMDIGAAIPYARAWAQRVGIAPSAATTGGPVVGGTAAPPAGEAVMPYALGTAAAATGTGPDEDGWFYALVTVDDVLGELGEDEEGADVQAAPAWNPAMHPRAPAGGATGGQFAPGGGAQPTPGNQNPVGQGETGQRVRALQQRLNALGAKPPLKVDGIFGPKTLAAVKSYQRAHGLKVDGLVGPKTTGALRLKNQGGGTGKTGQGTTGRKTGQGAGGGAASKSGGKTSPGTGSTGKTGTGTGSTGKTSTGTSTGKTSTGKTPATSGQSTTAPAQSRPSRLQSVARHVTGDKNTPVKYLGWNNYQVGTGKNAKTYEFISKPGGGGYQWRQVPAGCTPRAAAVLLPASSAIFADLEALAAGQWTEELHPRDAHGHFIPKGIGGGHAGGAQAHPAEALRQAVTPEARRQFGANIAKSQTDLQVAAATKQITAEMHAQMREMTAELERRHAQIMEFERAERRTEEHSRRIRKVIHDFVALAAVTVLTWLSVRMDAGPLVAALSSTGPLFLQAAVDTIKRL